MWVLFVMFHKSINFIRKINRKIYFSSQSFKIWWLLSGMEVIKNTKFQLNISKIMSARQKTTWTRGQYQNYNFFSIKLLIFCRLKTEIHTLEMTDTVVG